MINPSRASTDFNSDRPQLISAAPVRNNQSNASRRMHSLCLILWTAPESRWGPGHSLLLKRIVSSAQGRHRQELLTHSHIEEKCLSHMAIWNVIVYLY